MLKFLIKKTQLKQNYAKAEVCVAKLCRVKLSWGWDMPGLKLSCVQQKKLRINYARAEMWKVEKSRLKYITKSDPSL